MAQPDADSTDPDQLPIPAPDGSHLPGCPASPGADCFKWIEPAQQIVLDLPITEATAFLIVETAKVSSAVPAIAATAWPSSPPLYLSHCSLVI